MLHDVATIRANHNRFVARVAETEVVWGLEGSDGFASCPSNDDEDREVLMFWSDRAYAERVQHNAFPEYAPTEVKLFDFLYRWLAGMERDRALAGTNWNGDLAGLELEAADLRGQLITALGPDRAKKYAERFHAALKRQEG